MEFAIDPVLRNREIPRDRRPNVGLALATLFVAVVTFLMFYRSCLFEYSDIYVHAGIAADFNFLDLHSITSRLAYPLWHVFVAILYQLGVPLYVSAALVCAGFKVIGMLISYRLVRLIAGEQVPRWAVTLSALLLMVVTGICIPSINRLVYRPIGSPTVWHNPTQITVIATMLLCVPWTMHCWYTFQKKRDAGEKNPMIPWRDAAVLAVLTFVSLAAKPTFMQALIPAAAIFFAVAWAMNLKHWRFFVQMIIAFLPSVGYFLLQFLYYTGVVVPYSSGVVYWITYVSRNEAIRNALMLNAFPLFAILVCYRKGMHKDGQLILCLLMLVVSTFEAMAFHETGQRGGHGNFFWALMSVSLMLWVHMLATYLREIFAWKKGEVQSGKVRVAGYWAAAAMLLWHLGSAVWYVVYLLTWQAIF